ncbi:hypothetical protein Ccrd_022266 [Cynara cardunculus var. scolymus]|uniref:Uncharacterized protein n=1 Tax=Cynara cardunculus var. scolymus TaxID=59895 RepID=A0A103XZ13_CYNCS|nr:hypothetical protein Ccrd_022266 [Cynara cardunculus var. scolymus]
MMCATRKSGSERAEGVSVVGVQQIDRAVMVIEETLKGHEVRLLNRKTLPALDLPKVRKNKYVEILRLFGGLRLLQDEACSRSSWKLYG